MKNAYGTAVTFTVSYMRKAKNNHMTTFCPPS